LLSDAQEGMHHPHLRHRQPAEGHHLQRRRHPQRHQRRLRRRRPAAWPIPHP